MINITKEEFNLLADYIKKNYGIQLKEEKQALVTGRLHNVLLQKNFTNFTDYYNYLKNDKTGEAANTLISRISTNHTFFMRESDHFTYFSETVLPHLKQTIKNHDMRIWSAGCSSGEEAYTLAMLINDFLGPEKKLWDSKILATDISEKVLEQAQQGIYSNDHLMNLPINWKLSHFKTLDGQSSKISDAIRNEVIFGKFNLMTPNFPFKKKFHTIFCRNVMIYFGDETKKELVKKFYDMTEPGGYLFIGHSESLNRDETQYKYIMPAVYRKI